MVRHPRAARLVWPLVVGLVVAVAAGCRAPRGGSHGDAPVTRPVADVIAAAAPALIKIPGVVGVYEGETARHTPCIRVMIERRSPALERRIPPTLDGYPVEIEEGGPIRPLGR